MKLIPKLKTIKYKGKEYTINIETGLPCILDQIEEEKQLIKWAKENGAEDMAKEKKERLSGLRTALFFLTGKRD